MRTILEENIIMTTLASKVDFHMRKSGEKICVNLASATGPIEVVDNNSNHTLTSPKETYRMTTELHDKESYGTLSKKVDQIVPNLFEAGRGLLEGDTITVEVSTLSSSTKITVTRSGNNLSTTVISGSGTITIHVPVARSLFTPNRFGEYADLMRVALIVIVHCVGLTFQHAKNEERGFLKLVKKLKELWKT